MIAQLIAAMIGTIAFSLLFGVPKSYYLFCGLIGAAGWGIYLLISTRTGSDIAALGATMVVIFLSRLAAVKLRCPVTIFLIAGIFPLVPGAGVYWTTYYVVNDELMQALIYGYDAVKSAFAIVLGIVFIFELPQSLFTRLAQIGRRTKK